MSPTPALTPAPMSLDVMIQAPVWSRHADAEATVRRAFTAACGEHHTGGEVCVVLTNDLAIQELNRTWRGIDKPTNVLAFPAGGPGGDAKKPILGDVVIAYETTKREALAEDKPFLHHLMHLAVHGFLHLVGYDHQEDGQAEEMERREAEILAQLGVPDPYLVSDTTPS